MIIQIIQETIQWTFFFLQSTKRTVFDSFLKSKRKFITEMEETIRKEFLNQRIEK